MTFPSDRKYTETHEWLLVEGDLVTIGLTQYAADELTDITYVELPEIGAGFGVGDVIGEVESVKATSEVFCGVAGTVVETNTALVEHPELVNEDAFEEGWLVKLKADSVEPMKSLMNATEYVSFLRSTG